MKMEYTDVIIEPIITEKANELKESERYLCFKVHSNANKIMVKKAVEELFKTEVESVKILNKKGKMKRFGRYTGKRPDWKKAYVKLKKNAKMIEYVEVI